MVNYFKGGSLASTYVNSLSKGCYKTTGGGKKKNKNKSKRKRNSNHRKKQKGGNDWVTVVRSRGPVSYNSTYNQNQFRKFTKTGDFYSSQGKLNRRGGASHKKKNFKNQSKRRSRRSRRNRRTNNNTAFHNTVKRIGNHVTQIPTRLSASLQKEARDTRLNVTRSAERNIKDLNKELEGVLKQGIRRSGVVAKRGMRKGNQSIRKQSSRLQNKLNKKKSKK